MGWSVLVLWVAASGMAAAERAPLTVGMLGGAARWVGEVPGEYTPSRNGATVGLSLALPVGTSGWTGGGGAFGSVFAVRVPYQLEETTYKKRMRWDTVLIHADVGRMVPVSERVFYRARVGPGLVISGVGSSQGGTATLECEDDFCLPTGDYDIEDDRIVVKEAENEAPFLPGPAGYLSTGMIWMVGKQQPGVVISVDAFGVLTTTHWRSGMNGSHAGIVLGVGLGGETPNRR